MLTTFSTRHVRRYMEKNEETTMEEKVKLKINGGLRNTYLNLLCSDYHMMEACLRSFYGGFISELQWSPSMVIFNHGNEAKDKGEEVRGDTIHLGIRHGRRSFTTKRMSWIRSLESKLNGGKKWEKERGGHKIEGEKEGEKLKFEVCLTIFTFIKVMTSVTHVSIYSLGH